MSFLAAFLLAALWGCTTPSQKPEIPIDDSLVMVHLDVSAFPDFSDDMDLTGLDHASLKSLSYLQKLPSEQLFSFGQDHYTASRLIESLNTFRTFIASAPDKRAISAFIRENYRVYRSVGGDNLGTVLFTGYYEPHLLGSLDRTDTYRFPIYSRPADIRSIDLTPFSDRYKGQKIVGRYTPDGFIPYHDRMAIDNDGVLGESVPVLAWVQDPVDLFFLHIQGSGKIYLRSGGVLNVHYNQSNGRPYRSIGKLLIDTGKIPREEMSMQAIQKYLTEHPAEITDILNYNPSYVFFKIEADGPLGCINVKLTPGRSIATDRKIFPMAALAFIQTQKPLVDGTGKIHKWADMSRFVLNQDTGGAIVGPGRADVFWGSGEYAKLAAGHMQHPGELFFLILKTPPGGMGDIP